MTTTTYYDLNIAEGTDIVNPLTVDNPNYEKIDEVMHDNAVAGVTIATEIANATVHAITRENSECAVIRFIATSEWKAGDTATVDGVPVTALLPSGETLPEGAYVINANVLCILTGTNLTIYAERKKTENANEVTYNNTNVGAELERLSDKIDVVDARFAFSQAITPKTSLRASGDTFPVAAADPRVRFINIIEYGYNHSVLGNLVLPVDALNNSVNAYINQGNDYSLVINLATKTVAAVGPSVSAYGVFIEITGY